MRLWRGSAPVFIAVLSSSLACGGVHLGLVSDPQEPSGAGSGEPVKVIATFEGRNPFGGGTIVEGRVPEGHKALRIDKSYASIEEAQSWSGYDYLKVDLDSLATVPMGLDLEIRDAATKDYWTRVNYATVVPPGAAL